MKSDFGTAKGVLALIEAVGWASVVLGVLAAVSAASAGGLSSALLVGGGTVLSGLVVIALGQLGRAMISTADNTARLVSLIEAEARRGRPPESAVERIAAAQNLSRGERRAPSGYLEEGRADARGRSIENSGLVKVYKGKEIRRYQDGSFTVDGRTFSGVLSAERHIDDLMKGA